MLNGYAAYQKKSTPIVPNFWVQLGPMDDVDSKLPSLDTQSERLRWARSRFYPSARAAATALGWNENTYKSHEGGIRRGDGLPLSAVQKYARAFKVPVGWLSMADKTGTVERIGDVKKAVPVVGMVEAGIWIETTSEPPIEWIAFDDPQYARANVKAYRVRGPSMDQVYPEGTTVLTIHPAEAGLCEYDVVVLCRKDAGGKHELTLKELRMNGTQAEFWPRSNDKRYQAPYIPPKADESAQDGWEVVGVVIASYAKRPPRSGRFVQIQ